MAIRKSKPSTFSPSGVSDALDGTNVFSGACSALGNLVPDYGTPRLWAPRPASVLLTNFSGFTAPIGAISILKVIGNFAYGLIATGRNAGHEEPFCYNLATGAFVTISGVTNANTPIAASTVGAWEPPTCDLIGTYVVFTHPGFTLGGGVLFGWINIANPAAPAWSGGNVATNPLPARPSCVANFNGRAYYLVNIPNGQPGAFITDELNPLTATNGSYTLTFGDNVPLTAAVGLPLQNQLGGVLQSLMVFKANNVYQVTGDPSLNTLTLNTLNVATGTQSQRSVCTTPKGLLFYAPDGMRLIDFTATVSDPIGLYGAGVNRPFVNAVQPTRVNMACNVNTVRISTQNGGAQGSPWQEWWVDISNGRWCGPHTFPATTIQPWNNTFILAAVGVNAALWRSDNILSLTSTFVENGAQLAINFTTSVLPDEKQMAEFEINEMTMNMILDANGSTYSLQAIGGTAAQLASVIIPPPTFAPLWGAFTWGQADWASAQTGLSPIMIEWPAPVIGRKMQFQLVGNSYSTFRIGDIFYRYKQLGYIQQTQYGA